MKPTFKPAWWLPGPHLQTMWSVLFRKKLNAIWLKRERIELPDGDFVDLDWGKKPTGPIVMILHGLEGSSNSLYSQGLAQALEQSGWRVVVMNFRSCSGEINRLPRLYHSGDTADVATIVKILQQREPTTRMAMVGFSIGGNVLLKWLGETGSNNPLVAAVAISVPFELEKSVRRLEQGFSKIYQWHLLRFLKIKLAKKNQPPALQNFTTIYDFDDQVTAPLHGFSNAKDYYQQSSCRKFLANITVPTLLLHAKDDPFMPPEVIPQISELSASTHLEVTPNGGHVGFISGNIPFFPTYWLELRIPVFLQNYQLATN
jgi:predicted alpha/beta-fold hydrolase